MSLHATTPEAEALLGVKRPVLDHGYVALMDYMGTDSSIVQAARVSYGEGTKSVHDDRGLIRYLMRHQHTTPFEMVEFKFLVRLPIYVARQWIRHRTASVNEYSARYSVVPGEFNLPPLERIRHQSASNRQGSGPPVDPAVQRAFRDSVSKVYDEAYAVYQGALKQDVAREIARIVLPVGFYTQWYWKIDLHNLFHFLELRLAEHSQDEIRQYAQVMAEAVKAVVPLAFEAFEDFILNRVSFSSKEALALRLIVKGSDSETACKAAGLELFRPDGARYKTGEGPEFIAKLSRILSE